MTITLATPNWKSFEDAVASLLQALDPAAKVMRDVMTPDIHTGLARQRDVWIETRFGGHLPLSILVSCKRTKARISQQQMDAFLGELAASGATHGVIYSASGFTAPALAKARKLGVACCVLLENAPADLPGMLRFDGYCYRERVRLSLEGDGSAAFPTMADIFDLAVLDEGRESTVIAALLRRYRDAMGDVGARVIRAAPDTWSAAIEFPGDALSRPGRIRLQSAWRVYRARTEAWLVNGSYCFGNEDFKGSYSTPYVDRLGDHPGPGWEEIDAADVSPSGNVASFLLYGADWEPAIRAQTGGRPPAEFGGPERPAGAPIS